MRQIHAIIRNSGSVVVDSGFRRYNDYCTVGRDCRAGAIIGKKFKLIVRLPEIFDRYYSCGNVFAFGFKCKP